ncbi:phage baseplate assembly protein V [Cumulibacter manganitolerans]|uniref:phage baseplate assembly protein V n=1 Tax=Cumulibacter manganitolerans TaxID=1884992 RepID=UPI001296DB1D|nr:phage baseplate assembly protein V [Cumulibacter manganitolerans]
MIEDLMDAAADLEESLNKKFYGICTGTVVRVDDPLTLGRVMVRVPFVSSTDLSAWARVATPMSGRLAGHYAIPNPGDDVVVAFEHGDVNAPYVLGCLWNASAPPPMASPLPQVRMIRTPAGNQLGFREAPPAITLTTPDMTQAAAGLPPGITLASNTMITLQCGATRLTLSPAGVTITAPAVTVTSTGPVSTTGSTVSTTGTSVSITTAGVCSITGSLVKIN